MPLSDLLSSLRCTQLPRRSRNKTPPVESQKTSLSSDATDMSISNDLAASGSIAPVDDGLHKDEEHTVNLSMLDHGMLRHYTRFCLGFRLGDVAASEAVERLKSYFQRTFQAKPWLAGWVCPVRVESSLAHRLEIRFSQQDVDNFPVKTQELGSDVFPLSYGEFCDLGMPPSKMPRHIVSACPDRRPDTEPAPILDVTANVVRGGLIVAIFIHHGATDGAGMGSIMSGELCRDVGSSPTLTPDGLAAAAEAETLVRQPLSSIPAGQSIGTHPEFRAYFRAMDQQPVPPSSSSPPPPSDVTSRIFSFPDSALQALKAALNALLQPSSGAEMRWVTTHDALQSLLWYHLTRARLPSLVSDGNEDKGTAVPEKSTLLIPVNVRKRVRPPLPSTFLGGAALLVPANLPLTSLVPSSASGTLTATASEDGDHGLSHLLGPASTIHKAIAQCNDSYLREVLALTAQQSSSRNMADLNIDLGNTLDLVITSWAVFPIFGNVDDGGDTAGSSQAAAAVAAQAPVSGDIGLGMNLGPPDYLRKPWCRDAGGCIILPRDRRWKRGVPWHRDPANHHKGDGQEDGHQQQQYMEQYVEKGKGKAKQKHGETSETEQDNLVDFEPGLEVLIQLKTTDMERLVSDDAFMHWVSRIVD